MTRSSLTLAAALAALLVAPSDSQAQGGLLKRLKQTAQERAAVAAARAATAIVEKSAHVADTALAIGVTGVDSVAGRATGGAASTVDRLSQELPGALGCVGRTAPHCPRHSRHSRPRRVPRRTSPPRSSPARQPVVAIAW